MNERKNPIEKFKEFVEKKAVNILSKKIPEPRLLSKQSVDEKTTRLALTEMHRFKSAHDRLPTRQELDQIAEAIYRQIKDETEKNEAKESQEEKPRHTFLEERKKRRQEFQLPDLNKDAKSLQNDLSPAEERKRKRLLRRDNKEEEKAEGIPSQTLELPKQEMTETEVAGMDVSDIFSEEKTGKKQKELKAKDLLSDEDFGELEKDLLSLEEGADSISKEISTENDKCPNCKTRAEDILFCPECGTAFCSHCAKKVENLKDFTNFTCPKCGTTFKSKKKSA